MYVYEMRKEISKRYPGDKWRNRVNSMSDNQEIAIFHSMVERDSKAKTAKESPSRSKQLGWVFDSFGNVCDVK